MNYRFDKHISVIILVLLILVCATEHANACRYNVRETGFIYLEQKPYQIIIYYDDNTPATDIETLKQLALDHFIDSNIVPQFVNVDALDNTTTSLKLTDDLALPSAILRSPDGQTMKFPLTHKAISLEQSAQRVFRTICSSQKRDEINRKCISNYAVILLFESNDTGANKEAQKAAEAAIEHIASKMSLLPKKIDLPPTLVSIKLNDNDTILPWSLGLEIKDSVMPKMAIVYGRGRWIGPILEGDLISKRHLSDLLLIVGADCECGIDREWMRGTMIPASWNQRSRKDVAANLEFDPENPLIKKEVRNILRMGELLSHTHRYDTITSIPVIEDKGPPLQSESQAEDGSPSKYLLSILLGITVLVVLIGLFLFKSGK